MKFRFDLIALVSAVSLPALATSGFTPAPTEAGYTTHAMPSIKSRADVLKELETWQRNPVTADGWRQVGSEASWVFEGIRSTTTRAAVVQELMQAKRNPVSPDGWRDVGGEAGVVYVGVRNSPANARASADTNAVAAARR